MNPDARRTTYIGYQLLHPDLHKLEGNEIAEFYALLHGAYPLETCTHLGDRGGVIETEGWVTLNIEREGISYAENLRESLEATKDRATGIWAMARAHFGIKFYLIATLTFRQVWHVPEIADVPSHLAERALKITAEQFEPLGEGASVALNLSGDAENFHWHLELAPFYRESGTLFLQLDAYHFPPNDEDDPLRYAIDQVQDFLNDNVTKFVMGVLG